MKEPVWSGCADSHDPCQVFACCVEGSSPSGNGTLWTSGSVLLWFCPQGPLSPSSHLSSHTLLICLYPWDRMTSWHQALTSTCVMHSCIHTGMHTCHFFMDIAVSIHPSTIYPSIYPSSHSFIYSSLYLSIYSSTYIYLFIHLYIYLFIQLSTHSFIHPFVHLAKAIHVTEILKTTFQLQWYGMGTSSVSTQESYMLMYIVIWYSPGLSIQNLSKW